MSRHYYRCTDCLGISAANGARIFGAKCGACGGPIEHMGEVATDRLVKTERLCNCDERCTSARGPKCDCKCQGENHGAGWAAYTVVVVDAGGVPQITGPDHHAGRRAVEYRAALAAAQAAVNVLQIKRHAAAGWLADADYNQLRRVRAAIRAAVKARCHAARLRILAAWRPTAAAAVVQSSLFN